MADLVTAYDHLGQPSLVPSNWIGHPVLGAGWSLTPPVSPEPQTPPDAPTETETPTAEAAETPRERDKED